MSKSATPRIGPKALQAEQARLARFFETISKHRKALKLKTRRMVEPNSLSRAKVDPVTSG